MKYVDEFRDRELADTIAQHIHQSVDPSREYRLMEFCGGHTHAIFRHGVQDLVPGNVKFIHGPGCPVCVLPMGRIDSLLDLVNTHDVTVCTYGDVMRVPASGRITLQKARAAGADIRMVYSPLDTLTIARQNPNRHVVFFAIGFETTTPPTTVLIKQAERLDLQNFSVFCNHVLTPAALRALLCSDDGHQVAFDGVLGPSHVSTIIGSTPYRRFADEYKKPIVIAGFEPLDVMQSALMLIEQINTGRYEVENEYTRAVSESGNTRAMELVNEIFCLRESFEWRGLGEIPDSALKIRPEYAGFDTEQRYEIKKFNASDVKGCECPAILRGQKKPRDCKLFGTVCRPDNPMGACMVSSEGACAAEWTYGRHRAGN